MFCVTATDGSANRRFTDEEHLEDCILYAKHDWGNQEVYVNKAYICFDGYLVVGDYIGKR